MSFWRSAIVATGLLLAPGRASAAAPPAKPKLVVVISVDQFSAELYGRYRSRFAGGLGQLSHGIVFPVGYQSHAATETCPGHSTILTGMHPASTGIVANNWFDVKTGSGIYCVSVAGTADPEARGPQNLRVDTFGDWLKKAEPGARVVSVSGKDRAAIMLGGHHADAVYWWADGQGFRTSSFAGPATPKVLAPARGFNAATFAAWRKAPPPLWPAEAPLTCAALARPHRFGKLDVSGKVPPDASTSVETGEDFLARTDFQDQLRVSPTFDPMTLDFAAKLLDADQLGRGPKTDLLAISLSATDYIGHRYGNGGAEMCVQMASLDAALGAFLARIDALNVPYVVALTADHGSIDAAERAAEHGVAAERIDGAGLVKALNAYLEQTLDIAYEPIVGDDPQQLNINVPGDDAAFRTKLRDTAVAWLKTQKQVAQVFTAEEIAAAEPAPGTPPDRLSLAQRFHESYYPGRSGDIIVALAQYASVGMPRVPGDTVAGHGSPWDYDRRVPILFWWPGVSAVDQPAPAETVDIAPTLAALAGIAAPKLDGHCLEAVVNACPAR